MKIKEFIDIYNSKETDEEKKEIVRSHIKSEYIPFEKKADIAKSIVDLTFWKNENLSNGNETKMLFVDSVAKYMLTCMAMIDLFTDIERQTGDGKMLEDFNLLNEYGIIDNFIQNVNQRELKEFNMIIQMVSDDVMTNEYENHAFITKQVTRILDLINTTLVPVLEQIDIDEIQEKINGKLNRG